VAHAVISPNSGYITIDSAYGTAEIRAFITDRDPQVRAEAYRALTSRETFTRRGQGGSFSFRPDMALLLAGLKDPDVHVREAAAAAIEHEADAIAAPQGRAPGVIRFAGGGRGGFGFRGQGIVRGPGIIMPQMDTSVRDNLNAALDALLAMPEGTLQDSARVELTPLRIRKALSMFKTVQ